MPTTKLTTGVLTIDLKKATNLANCDVGSMWDANEATSGAYSDPVVTVTVKDYNYPYQTFAEAKSTVKKNDKNPVWDEQFKLKLDFKAATELKVTVSLDDAALEDEDVTDITSYDQNIGTHEFTIGKVNKKVQHVHAKLKNKDSNDTGMLHFDWKFDIIDPELLCLKLISAEGLMNVDTEGKSDPRVVIGCHPEGLPKINKSSKMVEENLSPVFEEEFTYPRIKELKEKTKFHFAILDGVGELDEEEDQYTSSLGYVECMIEGTSQFGFTEYEFDVKQTDKKTGEGINVGQCGKLKIACNFQITEIVAPKALKFNIISAKNLGGADDGTESDPKVVITVSGDNKFKKSTNQINDNNNPVWDQTLSFKNFGESQERLKVHFAIVDGVSNNDACWTDEWNTDLGFLEFFVQGHSGQMVEHDLPIRWSDGQGKEIENVKKSTLKFATNFKMVPVSQEEAESALIFKLDSATNLGGADTASGTASDPFVIIGMNAFDKKMHRRSAMIQDNNNPKWNQKLVFDTVEDLKSEKVKVHFALLDGEGDNDVKLDKQKKSLGYCEFLVEGKALGEFKLYEFVVKDTIANQSSTIKFQSNFKVTQIPEAKALKFNIISATHLGGADISSESQSDPKVKVTVCADGGKPYTKETKFIDENDNPVWNELLKFEEVSDADFLDKRIKVRFDFVDCMGSKDMGVDYCGFDSFNTDLGYYEFFVQGNSGLMEEHEFKIKWSNKEGKEISNARNSTFKFATNFKMVQEKKGIISSVKNGVKSALGYGKSADRQISPADQIYHARLKGKTLEQTQKELARFMAAVERDRQTSCEGRSA